MTDGRRWLALDADLFGKRFTDDLYQQFGWAGVGTWIAFLCACKQSRVQGRIRIMNDLDGLVQLGIDEWGLVDSKGQPWTLSEFFDFTGRKKQTRRVAVQMPDSRRIADARLLDVCATHWERWQDSRGRDVERERKRRSRAEKHLTGTGRAPGQSPDRPADKRRPDIDSDSDTPLTPPRGGGVTSSSNGQVNPQDLRAGIEVLRANLTPPASPAKRQP